MGSSALANSSASSSGASGWTTTDGASAANHDISVASSENQDGEKPILIEIVDSHDEVRMETVEGHQRTVDRVSELYGH